MPLTQLLEKALQQVQTLSPTDQDAIAPMIMDELVDEQRWALACANSQGRLAQLAKKVRADIQAGPVKEMGFGEL